MCQDERSNQSQRKQNDVDLPLLHRSGEEHSACRARLRRTRLAADGCPGKLRGCDSADPANRRDGYPQAHRAPCRRGLSAMWSGWHVRCLWPVPAMQASHLPNSVHARPPLRGKARPVVAEARGLRRTGYSDGLSEKNVRLRHAASQALPELFAAFAAGASGLSEREAERRLTEYGPNEVAHDRPLAWYIQLASAFKNPFNLVLVFLAAIELWSAPSDLKGPIIIGVMVAISVGIRFMQEFRSGRAAERLKALVRTTATVVRRATRGRQAPRASGA
jgi:hypothetical protein